MAIGATVPSLPDCAPAPSIWSAPLHVHLARLIVIPALLYIIFLVSLTVPVIQRFMLFLHKVHWPLFAKFDNPEVYGFAPNRVRNFYVRTPDGVRLGVWHILPLSIVAKHGVTEELPEAVFDEALRDPAHCVTVYMHGNAANRVTGHRKHFARHVSSGILDMNVILFDYRGFADSSNVAPSEEGLVIDARAIWDWLTLEKRVPPSSIVLAGQSLGTGVVCALAGRSLAAEGIVPRAIVLTAAFTSIHDVLLTYKVGEILPVLQPLRYVAPLQNYLFGLLSTHFDTLSVIRDIRCPLLLIHCISDGTIPPSHSQKLFQHLSSDATRAITQQTPTIQTKHIGKYAVLRELASPREGLRTQYLEMHFGGHNDVGYSEVALQTMKELTFGKVKS